MVGGRAGLVDVANEVLRNLKCTFGGVVLKWCGPLRRYGWADISQDDAG